MTVIRCYHTVLDHKRVVHVVELACELVLFLLLLLQLVLIGTHSPSSRFTNLGVGSQGHDARRSLVVATYAMVECDEY